jgi:hypothetical protein
MPGKADSVMQYARLIPADGAEIVHAKHNNFYNNPQENMTRAQGLEVAQTGANGWNPTMINLGLGGKGLGQWRMDRSKPNHWVETNDTGLVRFQLDEIQRDQWSVSIVDRSRDNKVQLDLWKRNVIYSDTKKQRFDLHDSSGGSSVILVSGCLDS